VQYSSATKQQLIAMTYSNGLRDIHSKAQIGQNVTIGSFTTIEEDVVIGDGCHIGSNVHIFNGARIGQDCRIFPGASISAPPQTRQVLEEPAILEIGNGTVIRECCTINRGNIKFGGNTIIGENCLLMAYVHVAHDCVIGHDSVLANNVTLAGHIEVGKWATLGGMVAVHQFVRIGEQTMIGGGSLVRKDVPPFVTAAREPLSYAGINALGLKRRGFEKNEMHHIEDIYRILFVQGYSINKAIKIIEQDLPSTVYRQQITSFIRGAKRGLMKGFRPKNT
jgi:UDP-N-acetylglucosamine acyltransferase